MTTASSTSRAEEDTKGHYINRFGVVCVMIIDRGQARPGMLHGRMQSSE
jgi:hypothetical protein